MTNELSYSTIYSAFVIYYLDQWVIAAVTLLNTETGVSLEMIPFLLLFLKLYRF